MKNLGVATSAVTFFRSLGGTIGVAVMGSILGTVVSENIKSGIGGLAPEQQLEAAQTLGSGTIPQISALPDFLRVDRRVGIRHRRGRRVPRGRPARDRHAHRGDLPPERAARHPERDPAREGRRGRPGRRSAGSADVEDELTRELEDAEDAAIDAAAASVALAPVGLAHDPSTSSVETVGAGSGANRDAGSRAE